MRCSKKLELKHMRETNAYACVVFYREDIRIVRYIYSPGRLCCFLCDLADVGTIDFLVSFNPYYKSH